MATIAGGYLILTLTPLPFKKENKNKIKETQENRPIDFIVQQEIMALNFVILCRLSCKMVVKIQSTEKQMIYINSTLKGNECVAWI